jgi:hypothetical protein
MIDKPSVFLQLLLGGLCAVMPLWMSGAATPADDELQEVFITAPEPRYVAPTRRDRIGRIWAPVYINDKGPFRLVLDTGATHSAVTAGVAAALGLPPNQSSNVTLRGVTGTAVVPTIRVDSLLMGELLLSGKRLPIITDALGGAEGILGTEGLADKRIFIDFRNDLIMITRSHNERAPPGFITIPVKFSHGRLLIVDAMMGNTRVKAIIDTGGQATIANLATRDALARRFREPPSIDNIIGATADVQQGEGHPSPAIMIGDLQIRSARMTFGDMRIFEYWKLLHEPAVLIGMDALGLMDTLIIDYQRAELQVRLPR